MRPLPLPDRQRTGPLPGYWKVHAGRASWVRGPELRHRRWLRVQVLQVSPITITTQILRDGEMLIHGSLPDCTPQGAVGGMHIGPTKGNLPEGIKWYGCQFQRAARDASVGQVEGDFESAPAVERSVETLEERGGPPTLGCGPG